MEIVRTTLIGDCLERSDGQLVVHWDQDDPFLTGLRVYVDELPVTPSTADPFEAMPREYLCDLAAGERASHGVGWYRFRV